MIETRNRLFPNNFFTKPKEKAQATEIAPSSKKTVALFQSTAAMEPETWNVMNALWLNHQKKPAGTPMSPALKKWVECVNTPPPKGGGF